MYAAQGGVTGAFSSKVADYAASRPTYPDALFTTLESYGVLTRDCHVADIGAGTGLFTASLLQRGCRVSAVEPNADMLAVANERFSGHVRYVGIYATAEATSLKARSIDVVTCAQAFHWFDALAVRKEWLRILKPSGHVVLTWNTRPLDDPLQNAFDDLLVRFAGEKHTALQARQQLEGVPAFFAGMPFQELAFANTQQLDRAGFVSLLLSRSTMPDRTSPLGHAAVEAASKLFDAFAQNGAVTMHYLTAAFLGRLA
jgi:SAM-dependent methyltransferase